MVLLGIMMPDMEGTEVLDKMKKDKDTLGIPVIMLSAKGDELTKNIPLFYMMKPM